MNKYEDVNNETIGEGGQGKAKLVCPKSDKNKKCIMKIMNYDQYAEKESQMLKSLDNKYIVKYIDSFRNGSKYHIVMEYAEGGDLRHMIREQEGKPFSEYYVRRIFGQLCEAIRYIHSRNILHRDLKPENVFLDCSVKTLQDIKLGDFGISKQLVYNNGYAKTCCGTISYMAPEVLLHRAYDKKADIYSLGCILFELLTLKQYEYPNDPSNARLPSQYKSTKYYKDGLDIRSTVETHPYLSNDKWRNLLKIMLSENPGNRPSIEKVIEIIQTIKYAKKDESPMDFQTLLTGIFGSFLGCGFFGLLKK